MTAKYQDGALIESLLPSFQQIIAERTGLFFSQRKWNTLKKVIGELCDSYPGKRCENLLGILSYEPTESKLWAELISELTINETFFFRHFNGIEKSVLPQLVEKKRDSRQIRIWSAGCSTGEEPYSIAMVLCNIIPDIKRWNIQILATDIDKDVLNFAKKGKYREWSMRQIPDTYKKQYFNKKNEHYLLDPAIKKIVNFDYLNLKENTYPSVLTNTVNLDIIFCRNVTIYFEAHDTMKIANRFYQALNTGGKLIVGHSEPSSLIYGQFFSEIVDDVVVYSKEEKAKTISKPLRNILDLPVDRRRKSVPKTDEAKKEAEKDYKEDRRKNPNIFEMRLKAKEYFDKNELEKAQEILDKIILLNRKDAKLFYLGALVKAKLGNLELAEQYCRKALEIEERFLEAMLFLSIIIREEKRFEDAKKILHKLIYFDGNFLPAYLELMQIAMAVGDTAEKKRLADKIFVIAKKLDAEKKYDVLEGMTVSQIIQIVKLMSRE